MQRRPITRWYAIAILAGSATNAAADGIPTIKLTDAGPDQDIPTKHSFYVTGDAGKNTVVVQAVIAKKGSAAMFGSDGPTCDEFAGQLHINRSNPRRLGAGVHSAFELFATAAPEVRNGKVLVSAQWTPPPGGDAATYQVLVPTDETFFEPGYSFCLYVLRQTQRVDDTTIATAIDDVAAAFDQCVTEAAVANAASHKAAIARCKAAAQSQFDARIDKLLDHALLVISPGSSRSPSCQGGKPTNNHPSDRDKAYCELKNTITVALGHAETVHLKRADLDKSLAVTAVPDLSHGWLGTSGNGNDLGQAIVTMLTNQGSLFPSQKAEVTSDPKARTGTRPAPTTSVEHLTKDGKIAVAYVSILDDDRRIRVASSTAPSADQTRVLDGVTTDNLVVAAGITLHDLLLLGHGIIPGHGVTPTDQDTTFAELRTAIRQVGLVPAWGANERAYFARMRDRLGKISDVADIATLTAFDEETPASVLGHIKTWLAAGGRLPGDVKQLAVDLKTLVDNKEAFDVTVKHLAFVASQQFQLGGPQPVPFHIGFDQKTWLFSYVTPTVGHAQIHSHDGWFSTVYFAAQIHLFPNPVDDPMYLHGIARDLKRSFALELGFASSVTSFGPDDRYRGVFGLPPPFIALALHPLPYTSISVGEALLERRTTVLSVESPHWAPSFFVGFNVQLNVPDLIRSQKTSSPTVGSATNTNP